MDRQLHRLLTLPLLLASTLTFLSPATASSRPNLCPITDGRGTAVGTTAIIDAETSDRYFSICRDPEQGNYAYVSKLKSGGKTVWIPVNKSGFGWSSNGKNEYKYVVSTVSKKLFVYKSSNLILRQNFLVYRLNKSTGNPN
jgi:hypothetical protein